MPLKRKYLLLLPGVALSVAWAEPAAQLDAVAEPAAAVVRPLPPGRKLVRLPALEYRIGISARCAGNDSPESVSISIADSRKTLAGEALADRGEIVVDFTVPARQVAPLPVDGFCLADGGGAKEVLVSDVVTASLSLRCTNGEGTSITYASQALAVAISCDTSDQGAPDSPIAR